MSFERKKLQQSDIDMVLCDYRKHYRDDIRILELDTDNHWIVNNETGEYALWAPKTMREDSDRYLFFYCGNLFKIDAHAVGYRYGFQNYPSELEPEREKFVSLFSDIIILYGCFLSNAKPDIESMNLYKSGKAKNNIFPLTIEKFIGDNHDFSSQL